MNINDNTRLILFIIACIPVRLAYAYIQNNITPQLNFISAIIGILFIYKWATWKGEKGAFGGVLWWNTMRLVHGVIFILASRYPKMLYLDVAIGALAKFARVWGVKSIFTQ